MDFGLRLCSNQGLSMCIVEPLSRIESLLGILMITATYSSETPASDLDLEN